MFRLLSQYTFLDASTLRQDATVVAKLFKIPYKAFGAVGPNALHVLGLPEITRLEWSNVAAMARAATKTFSGWQGWGKHIREAAEVEGSINAWFASNCKCPNCDSHPIVLN